MNDGDHSGLAMQRDVTRLALIVIDRAGFALAGSGAIREHGIINRLTEDVDLFTTVEYSNQFDAAVDEVIDNLGHNGYTVEQVRRAKMFARLQVASAAGLVTDVDLGVDWRAEDPVVLDVGPVLSVSDSVGNKACALYGRGEARDFLDVDVIRASGQFTDEELLAAMAERDPGFDSEMFAQQLRRVERLQPAQVARYGVTPTELHQITLRFLTWAESLAGRPEKSAESQTRFAQELAHRSFPRFPGRESGPEIRSTERRETWPDTRSQAPRQDHGR